MDEGDCHEVAPLPEWVCPNYALFVLIGVVAILDICSSNNL